MGVGKESSVMKSFVKVYSYVNVCQSMSLVNVLFEH